jgi:hypothetical protein
MGNPFWRTRMPKLIDNQIEGIVCPYPEEKITFYDLDEFYKFCKSIIANNITERNEMGSKLKNW